MPSSNATSPASIKGDVSSFHRREITRIATLASVNDGIVYGFSVCGREVFGFGLVLINRRQM